MSNKIILAWLILSIGSANAQVAVTPTDSFRILGEIKNPQTLTLTDLQSLKSFSFKEDITTLNHLGQAKGAIKQASGVLLRDILGKIELSMTSPKQVYGFYVECIASDGYKTVFSWNEIMNSINGENIYILTGRDGKTLTNLDDRIAILVISAPGKAHVNIKGLNQLLIQQVR